MFSSGFGPKVPCNFWRTLTWHVVLPPFTRVDVEIDVEIDPRLWMPLLALLPPCFCKAMQIIAEYFRTPGHPVELLRCK